MPTRKILQWTFADHLDGCFNRVRKAVTQLGACVAVPGTRFS